MNNDLISRDNLKKEFDIIASNSATGDWQTIPIRHIKQIIDNAPTVERPQGHWINSQVGQTCNLCNEIQFGYDSFRNFCPNCGADMRGEKK